MNETDSSSQEEDNASNTTTASSPSTIKSETVPSLLNGTGTVVRTLDGDMAGDEFAREAAEYQMLLGKIDELLKRLELDA
jgi:DNA primase